MSVDVSAEDVKALRERTGAGMMDCKAALQEAGGDVHGQLFREHLEIIGARHEVGFTIHLDEHANFSSEVDVVADDPVLGDAAGALGG